MRRCGLPFGVLTLFIQVVAAMERCCILTTIITPPLSKFPGSICDYSSSLLQNHKGTCMQLLTCTMANRQESMINVIYFKDCILNITFSSLVHLCIISSSVSSWYKNGSVREGLDVKSF